MTDQTPSMKTRLRRLLDRGWEVQRLFVDRLTDAQRGVVGKKENWSTTSPKDVISHITFWKRTMAQDMRLARAGQGSGASNRDELAANDQNFADTHDLSWTEILAEAASAYQMQVNLLNELSAQELTAEPYFSRFVGNNYLHPVQHLVDFHLANNALDQAAQLNEQILVDLNPIGVPSVIDIATYNVACFYARIGDSARAIALLAEPLKHDPKLLDWSKHDPDLESLRADPAFQALYDQPTEPQA